MRGEGLRGGCGIKKKSRGELSCFRVFSILFSNTLRADVGVYFGREGRLRKRGARGGSKGAFARFQRDQDDLEILKTVFNALHDILTRRF